jgi:hypothetical protein
MITKTTAITSLYITKPVVFVIYVLCFLSSKNCILNGVIYRKNLLKFQWTVMKLNACTYYNANICHSDLYLSLSSNRSCY